MVRRKDPLTHITGRRGAIIRVYKTAAPTSADSQYDEGTVWVDRTNKNAYILVNKASGVATWDGMSDASADASTTVKGIIRIGTVAEQAAGALNTVSVTPVGLAAMAIAGAPAWSETVSGIGQLSTAVEAVAVTNDTTAMTPLKVGQVFAAPPAIGSGTAAAGAFAALSATGLASLGASATIVTGTVALSLGADASTGAINMGTGAAARTITIGNITTSTAVAINSGTGHITLTSTGTGDVVVVGGDKVSIDAAGTVELNSSAAAISIGNDDIDQAVNIATDGERTLTMGSDNGAASTVIQSGTGALNVGTNAIAHSITIGNNTGATALVLETGTGDFTLDGVATSTYTIASAVTSGTIAIGGTAQTGTMTLGDSSGTNIVQIGSGEGATTLNLLGGATSAKALNICQGAIAGVITIGNSTGASQMDLKVGTGNFSLEGAVTSTYEISSTGANTGTCKFASGTGARTVEIAGGGTGVKTVNIATGATADVVTIGTTTGAGTTDIIAGSGGLTLNAAGIVDMVPATSTAAAATGTVNANVGSTTHTGLTTAAAASQVFTITNSVCTASSAIFVSASNLGANDAQMTVTRVTPAVGSFTVTLTNNGAAALNGNVILNFWIIAA